MPVAKIEKDIKVFEAKLAEINANVCDPIERNEQIKEIDKKLKKLKRTKSQTEQLVREQQELESLKSDFILESNELPAKVKEPEVNKNEQIEVKAKELIPTISQSAQTISTPDSQNKAAIPWIKIQLFAILGLVLPSIIIGLVSYNNTAQKSESARLEELAKQESIKESEEIEKARIKKVETEQEKYRPITSQAEKRTDITRRNAVDTVKTISPENFIRKHYSNLNNRDYYSTWQSLTTEFKNKSTTFDDYQEWWNSVDHINIGYIQTLEQSNDTALVDVQLSYSMKMGTVYQDPKSKIYLVWDKYSNNWLVKDKQASYFDKNQFPLNSCGDRDPGGTNTWYPVFIDNTEHNFDTVRNEFCHDAILKYREEQQTTSIQAASFIDKTKAAEFALILQNSLGTGEVGEPKTHNFR